MGDINCDYLQQNNQPEVKRFLLIHGLQQIVKNATCVTKRTPMLIDVIATMHKHTVSKQITEARSLSDPDYTGVIIKKNCQKLNPRNTYAQNYAKYNEANFKDDLKNAPWKDVFIEADINTAWNKFKQILKSVVNKHAPPVERKIKGRECPWLSYDIKVK